MRIRKCSECKLIGSILLISVIVTGCSSLQVDLTPPPTEELAEESLPTPRPTLPASQPEATVSLDELGSEVIIVNVVDHTGGVLLDKELEVELSGYEDFDLVYEDSEVISSSGQVIFEGVPLLQGRVYFASIYYGGAIYRSEIVELNAETTIVELTLQIYETTNSIENLVIDRIHLIIDFSSPGYAQLVEIFIMSNLGDSTVVAANPDQATVVFPLPDGAEAIEFEDGALGGRYLRTEDGFGDTVSIPPGLNVYQVLVYYMLPIQRNKINFSQQMNYPVQAVIVMTPAGEAVIKGSTLEDRGIQTIPDGSVQLYAGSEIARGDSLDFQISVQSAAGSLSDDGSVFLSQSVLIGAGILGGMLFAIGIWLLLRQRRGDLELVGDTSQEAVREQILDSLIALEDLYKDGEIDEGSYQNKRQEYEGKLASLDKDSD